MLLQTVPYKAQQAPMAVSLKIQKPSGTDLPFSRKHLPELNAIKEAASRALFAADAMKSLLSVGSRKSLPLGSGRRDFHRSGPSSANLKSAPTIPSIVNATVAPSHQENPSSSRTSSAQSRGQKAQASRRKFFTSDQDIPNTSTSNTEGNPLRGDGIHSSREQTLDLDVIVELHETIAATKGNSAKSLPPLTNEQALALLELMNKVIRPTLESSLRRFEGVFSDANLIECANYVAIQVVRNHLPSGLLTGRILENLYDRKAFKKLIGRIFEKRILDCEPLPAIDKPMAQSIQVIDLSMLDAGETVPISTRGQNSQNIIPKTSNSNLGLGSIDTMHVSRPRTFPHQQAESLKEKSRVKDDVVRTPGRSRGRLPKPRDSIVQRALPAKQHEQSPKRKSRLQDGVVSSSGRPRGRPPKLKHSIVQVKVLESRKNDTLDPRPHANHAPSINTSIVLLGPVVTNTFAHNYCKDKASCLPVRLQRRETKVERCEQRQIRIRQSHSSHCSTLIQDLALGADPGKAKLRPSRQNLGVEATKLEALSLYPSNAPAALTAHLFDELGCSRRSHNCYSGKDEVRERYYNARTWQRASGDIITGAWHCDSDRYILGATATTDNINLQYNRPYNLLFGDIPDNTLRELSDHYIAAPKPNNANISKLSMTIETVRFSGDQFYTASHDKTVKIWDVAEKPICSDTVRYEHHASLLEVSGHNGTVAVGIKRTNKAIHVFNPRNICQNSMMGSSRAEAKPAQELYPSCLAWGTSPATQNLLLAGFLRWGELPDGSLKKEGHLCLWDVATGQELIIKPSAQGVYTTAWCPRMDGFAAGGIPGQYRLSDSRMQSVVRVWDLRVSLARYTFEFECSAQDQGEASFHPRDDNLLVVACTDGASYVYDCRNPDTILHRLPHGDPIENNWVTGLDSEGQTREEGDGGVMLCEWGNGRNLLYTGSSDGVLKTWDVRRGSDDVLVQDVAHFDSGITFGKFSPDFSRLLVGDASGGVHIVSNDHRDGVCNEEATSGGEDDRVPREMQMLYAEDPANQQGTISQDDNPGTEGITIANKAVLYGQAVIDPHFGALQGPKYKGPYNYTDTHHPIESHSRAGFMEERRQRLDAARRIYLKQRGRARNRSGLLMSPPAAKRARVQIPRSAMVEVIDITSDTENDEDVNIVDFTKEDIMMKARAAYPPYPGSQSSSRVTGLANTSTWGLTGTEGDSWMPEDLLEEDHWFPDEDPVVIGCFARGGAVG